MPRPVIEVYEMLRAVIPALPLDQLQALTDPSVVNKRFVQHMAKIYSKDQCAGITNFIINNAKQTLKSRTTLPTDVQVSIASENLSQS